MTAAVLTGHGGADQLEVRDDVEVPHAGPGQVLIEVAAAAVNTTDLWTREGAYGSPEDPDAVAGWQGRALNFPRIQGGDVAGRVVAAGAGVDEAWLGCRVVVDPTVYADDGPEPTLIAVLGSEFDGGFARYVAVAVEQVHDMTGSPLTDAQLACLPIAYGTAAGMLDRVGLRTGETVLVTGASGGVGLALVQLARARGATVVALTRTGHADVIASNGAHHTVARDDDRTRKTSVSPDASIPPTDPDAPDVSDTSDLPLRIREAAGGAVDVVADVVGGWVLEQLLDVLAPGGRWVICGAVAGPVVRVDLRVLYLHRRQLIGSTMHTPDQFRRLMDDARSGRIDPRVARTYPLTQIDRAQADLAAGGEIGKIVLLPT